MDVTVIDATGNKTEDASVPGDAASGRILARLVELMNLPTSGPDGQPLSYRFHHKQSGRQLDDNESLEQAGVRNGDVLRLVAEITAGAGGASAEPVEMSSPLSVDIHAAEGRYHRQSLISWWDQDRLADASVLVVGAGALGNELIKNLALLGVGTLIIADGDAIENSNLARCVLFRESDSGRWKAETAGMAAEELNPNVHAVSLVGDVRLTLGLGAFAAVDVVVGGLDNREARLHVNQACWKTSTPWIDGAIEGISGVLRSFVPPSSACYECTLSARDYQLMAARRACSLLTPAQMLEGKVPTTATSAGVVGAMQALEAVKLLHSHRLDYEFGGSGFFFNGLTHDSYRVAYGRREDCLSHDVYDLEGAPEHGPDASFGSLLERARADLGPAAVLDLEQELAVAAECGSCGDRLDFLCPVHAVQRSSLQCERCGVERRLELLHTIDGLAHEVLDLTPRAVGLPVCDVVTARAPSGTRRHYLIKPPGDPLDVLRRHG
jgi:molybdopterin/thiamine biosynthesis adenylyltransferase